MYICVMDEITKEDIKGYIKDLVASFLYYDRKEDEDLPIGEIERLISKGTISIDEICSEFRLHLESGLKS